jgi:rhodanese-related sulfurtransferase
MAMTLEHQHSPTDPDLRIELDRAWELYQRGEATILDVRDPAEYEREHLPGAVSMPLRDLSRRISEVSFEKTVITYCA